MKMRLMKSVELDKFYKKKFEKVRAYLSRGEVEKAILEMPAGTEFSTPLTTFFKDRDEYGFTGICDCLRWTSPEGRYFSWCEKSVSKTVLAEIDGFGTLTVKYVGSQFHVTPLFT